MKRRHLTFLFLSLMLVLLSGCNLPANQTPAPSGPQAVFTAAAQTVEAKLTQNALGLSVTNTPPPAATDSPQTIPTAASTITPIPLPEVSTPSGTVSPTPVCDAAQFVADVSVPDGTKFAPGETFTKTWRLKNIGTCTWDTSYAIVFDNGDALSGPGSLPLTGPVGPGQQVELTVTLKAPQENNTYRSYWKLRNGAGVFLPIEKGYNNQSFYVEIQVKDGTTASGGGKFAVTSVGFAVARDGSCASGKYVVTASVTVNKPGQVTYTWLRSDGATGAANSGTLDFTSATSQNLTFEWSTSATGLWVDLYVDNPNHQQFGRATLNCP